MGEIRLSANVFKILQNGKNLLAFSHGVDSTALFYILIQNKIKFDLAMVDYNTRVQSKDETSASMDLAHKFNKQIFIKSIRLSKINFESQARMARYEFFDDLCCKFGYTNVILAHQLNDAFEWLLMQLSRGAGVSEMIGMQEIEKRENLSLIRPLLSVSRDEILAFLTEQKIAYFSDESNLELKFKRNYFRAKFANEFVSEFGSGLKKSFEYLRKDKELLNGEFRRLGVKIYAVRNDSLKIRGIDQCAKMLGYVMSKHQRDETIRCLNLQKSCVIGGKIAIGWSKNFILITPFLEDILMDKKFKEKCRKAKIPSINRTFLFVENSDIFSTIKFD